MGFNIDDEIADALSSREEEIEMTKSWYEAAYRSSQEWRERPSGH
jgi:hypothetical protein